MLAVVTLDDGTFFTLYHNLKDFCRQHTALSFPIWIHVGGSCEFLGYTAKSAHT